MGALELEFSLVAEAEPPEGITEDQLRSLVEFVLGAEGAAGPWEIAVALVEDPRLQALHRDYLGMDTPTDIMTFPDDESVSGVRGGDLVISVDHARTQAATWNLTPADEVRFLVVHGLLHLLEWRDETAEQRERMLARQSELVDRWRQDAAEPV